VLPTTGHHGAAAAAGGMSFMNIWCVRLRRRRLAALATAIHLVHFVDLVLEVFRGAPLPAGAFEEDIRPL
jgi:hypothetical protein